MFEKGLLKVLRDKLVIGGRPPQFQDVPDYGWALTYSRGKDILQIRIRRKESITDLTKGFIVQTVATDTELLKDAKDQIDALKGKTIRLDIPRTEFLGKVSTALGETLAAVERMDRKDLEKQVDRLRKKDEADGSFNVGSAGAISGLGVAGVMGDTQIMPAIGIEVDGDGFHPVFGVGLGGPGMGGLLLYDPVDGGFEAGGYIGFVGVVDGVGDIGADIGEAGASITEAMSGWVDSIREGASSLPDGEDISDTIREGGAASLEAVADGLYYMGELVTGFGEFIGDLV